jgi:hypothetical protein
MPVIAENAVKAKKTILSNMSEIRTPMNANYSLKVVLKQI